VHRKGQRELSRNVKVNRKPRIIDYNGDFGELVLFSSNKYQPVHRWYQIVEGFSSELVRRIIGEQEGLPQVCIDPFGGVGTTALTCQEIGVKCISFENNPFFYSVARTKLRTDYDPAEFQALISKFEKHLKLVATKPKLPELESTTFFETKGKERWIFNIPVAYGITDILTKLTEMEGSEATYKGLFHTALAAILVLVSNVFRNGKCMSYKENWKERRISRRDVHERFINVCRNILLVDIRTQQNKKPLVHNYVHCLSGDARNLVNDLKDNSIDLVITSPPYLNSRDYADIYRLELWILGHISTFDEERRIRKSAIRSHVQTTWDDCDYPRIKELERFINHLDNLNGKLWNSNIPKMVKGYFSDIHNILSVLRNKVRPRGSLYINVANSAYGGEVCQVDIIISEIAAALGYHPIEIRQVRYVKPSRQQRHVEKLRESIILLQN
jgi:DNA modification methylase